MAGRTSPPFRFDHVGSFLRPAVLAKAREDWRAHKITLEQLKVIEDQEITKLVAKQKEVGLKTVTDGEFRRSFWHIDFWWGFEGVVHTYPEDGARGLIFTGPSGKFEIRSEGSEIKGKFKFVKTHPFIEHFKFLQALAGDAVPKLTIPGPVQSLFGLGAGANDAAFAASAAAKVYGSRKELVADIIQGYRDAIAAFYEVGCRSLQVDDCRWSTVCDRQGVLKDVAILDVVGEWLEIENAVLSGWPADLTINTHTCRGNNRSGFLSSGGYDPVAEPFFKRPFKAFLLEYDSDRAGGFEPLRFVPSDRLVVLGLLSSKFPQLEPKEQIIKRLQEAAAIVPLDRLCLSTQCGFASTEEGNVLTEEEQWAKLAYIKTIVDEVWK